MAMSLESWIVAVGRALMATTVLATFVLALSAASRWRGISGERLGEAGAETDAEGAASSLGLSGAGVHAVMTSGTHKMAHTAALVVGVLMSTSALRGTRLPRIGDRVPHVDPPIRKMSPSTGNPRKVHWAFW
jgi:hypothetical protein